MRRERQQVVGGTMEVISQLHHLMYVLPVKSQVILRRCSQRSAMFPPWKMLYQIWLARSSLQPHSPVADHSHVARGAFGASSSGADLLPYCHSFHVTQCATSMTHVAGVCVRHSSHNHDRPTADFRLPSHAH